MSRHVTSEEAAMQYDDFRRSDDIEDRRDSSGGGMGGLTAPGSTVSLCIFVVSLDCGWQMKRAATLVAALDGECAL